jgi:hypothetical protein
MTTCTESPSFFLAYRSMVGGTGHLQDWLDRSRMGGCAGICQTPGCDAEGYVRLIPSPVECSTGSFAVTVACRPIVY